MTYMKITKARVTNYKSILDSGWVAFDDVTCMVGKNESGKTAFLEAIEKIKPVDQSHAEFDYVYDYPTSKYTAYKSKHESDPDTVVRVECELSDNDRAKVADVLGPDALDKGPLSLSKDYKNKLSWGLKVDDGAAVRHLSKRVKGQSPALDVAVDTAPSMAELAAALEAHGAEVPAAQELLAQINSWPDRSAWQAAAKILQPLIPRFFYFDDYSVMQGRISLDDLIRRQESGGNIADSEKPFLALLKMIGSTAQELRDETHGERLTRELEGASVAITDEMFKFWKQNRQLVVQFERKEANPSDPAPLNEGKVLGLRIYNQQHRASVPFDQRSKGFVWFFSFLVYFQQLEKADAKTILLLDEPALSLHALAQRDFLEFIDERLRPEHQVIYTTHSPFMVDASKLPRVRTVTDKASEGTVVSDEVFRTDSDTVFPLQAALGYDLAQTLFVGPNCLLVEGPSDMIYLDILNAAIASKGGETLNEGWVKVPVGGADKLYTFVTLLGGNQLNAVALIDVSKKEQQRIANLQSNGHLAHNGLIQIAQFTAQADADIEDLFDPDFFLKLVNGAYATELGTKKITTAAIKTGSPRIVMRVADYFKAKNVANGEFNHFRPASFLLANQGSLLAGIDEPTLTRAEALIKTINQAYS